MSTSSVTGTPSWSICIMGSCSPILASDHPRAPVHYLLRSGRARPRCAEVVTPGSVAGAAERGVVPPRGSPAFGIERVAAVDDVATGPPLVEHRGVHVADLPPLGEVKHDV